MLTGKIRVEITETYKGSQHWFVRIYLPGFGENHEGFVLANIREMKAILGDNWGEFLGDRTLRPEYAKEIKARLEGSASVTTCATLNGGE